MGKKTKSGPDWLQNQVVKITTWTEENQAGILLVIVPILLVGFGAIGWQYFSNKISESRRLGLFEIDKQLEVVLTDAEEKRSKFQEQIADRLSKLDDAGKKKDSEKKEADPEIEKLTAQMEAVTPDFSGVVKQYEEFFQEHSTKVEGWRAAPEAAVLLIQEREATDMKKAVELIQMVLDHSASHEVYGMQARLMMVSILEELEDYQTALSNVETSLEHAEDDIKPGILMTKARILRGMGQNDVAKEVLNEVISQFDGTVEAQKARAVLAL